LDAKSVSVDLITAPKSPGIEGTDRLLLCNAQGLGGAPDFVIGHDHITGRFARVLATRFNSKYVHFIHTIPQENEALKSPRDDKPVDLLAGHAKSKNQVELGEASDLVVAVGPRIRNHFEHEAANPPTVTMLLPGMDQRLLELSVDPTALTVVSCLMSGRMEDINVKGGLLACDVIKLVATGRAWGSGKMPRLAMRGFSEQATAEFKKIGDYGDYNQFISVKMFSADPATLLNDHKKAALVMMPSIAEGFGLTGLEGIAAGVPVVISRESGLAQYLEDPTLNENLPPDLVQPCIAPVAQDDETNRAEWKEKVDAALIDLDTAFKRASALRDALKTRLTWDSAARKLTLELLAL
jgi:glycosyltransferase involved in cell wall biosynthesis